MILTPSLYSLEIERPESFSWRNHLFAVSARYLAEAHGYLTPRSIFDPQNLE